MKVHIQKSKKLIKISILALLLTYAAFFCYGAIMAFDFCNGPMGPADPSERSACFQLNHTAYQRVPLLIDHPAFEKCSFLRMKRGNYWTILNCLKDNQESGLFRPMDDVESDCTVFKNQSDTEILGCITRERKAKEWVLDNQSNPYYAECIEHWSQYSNIEMCMESPAWRK